MNIYYLKPNKNERNIMKRNSGAFGKARQDADMYFDEIGAKPIGVYAYKWDDESKSNLRVRMDGMLGILKSNDVLIQSYPTGTNSPVHTKMLISVAHSFGAKIIAYIHDIGAFRATFREHEMGIIDLPGVLEFTKKMLNMYDGLIVPTYEMKIKIRFEFNYSGPITIQGPYGFISNYTNDDNEYSLTINYAGSLSKGGYLFDAIKNNEYSRFALFGSLSAEFGREIFKLKEETNVKYYGQFDPDAIITQLQNGIGLVWDSDSYKKISGGLGIYQLVNSPHKFSMYLAAGLPVIVWEKSAIAYYVKKYNLGWTLRNLEQLSQLLSKIDKKEFFEKKKNAGNYGEYIRSGIGLKSALFDLIQKVNLPNNSEIPTDDPFPMLGKTAFLNKIDEYEI